MNELNFDHPNISSRARCFNCSHGHDVVCTVCHECGCKLYTRKGKSWTTHKSLEHERISAEEKQHHPNGIHTGEAYFTRCITCGEQTRPTNAGSSHFKVPRQWALKHYHDEFLTLSIHRAEE